MIKAIFFDFNGVIIDDERIQMKAYQELLAQHEIDLTSEWYLDCLGMDDKTFVQAIFKRAGKYLSDNSLNSILEAKTQLHREIIDHELPLFPGVVTFVKGVARRVAVNLVSMASRVEVSYVLERAGLQSYFSVVVTADDVSACKPAPDCYLSAFNKLNELRQADRELPVLPSECLAIEDAPPGILAARAAGMHTMGVTNTVEESALRAAGAQVVTGRIGEWTFDAVQLVYS